MDVDLDGSEPVLTETKTDNASASDEIVEEKVCQESKPFSKKLDEIIDLMYSVNYRLEELSKERRSDVSQIQWSTLEKFKASLKTNQKTSKFWQKSIFMRTYFIDKDLDESFYNVVKNGSTFFSHLQTLKGKIDCHNNNAAGDHMDNNIVKQIDEPSSETDIDAKESAQEESEVCDTVTSPQRILQAKAASNDTQDEGRHNMRHVKNIQKSFTDLIRSKIEFDSQFLNFNAVFSKNRYTEDFLCLYKICTNSNLLLEKSSVPTNKRAPVKQGGKKIRRKRISGNLGDNKSQKNRLRRSRRIAVEDTTNDVEIIDHFKRTESA